MQVKLDENNELLCPHCDSNYLHHGTVTVYSREEDDAAIVRTEVSLHSTHAALVPNAKSGNPSSRRGGFAITFWCETCNGDSRLTFAQHKGVTAVKWEK